MTKFSRKTVLFAGCAAIAVSTPAFAQESADGAEDGNVIYVTAQNRTEDVQDVPIAIEVISAEDLANAGFASANDLGAIAPVVQVNQDQGTVKITVRGIGTNSNDEAQDTSVVANIDGEYINRPNVLSVALFDLDRVEVLRGPQGTLYGRNSTGGAINFVTRKPADDFGFNGSVSYGNYNDVRIDAGVDVPLAEQVGLRVAGFFNDRDGYVDHPAVPAAGPFPAFAGGSSDDNQSYGGRATLALTDLDGLSITLAGEYAERKYIPQAFASVDLNSGGVAPTGPGCNAPGFEQIGVNFVETLCVPTNTNFLEGIDRSEYRAPAFGLGLIKQDTWALRGRVEYEFGPAATLTYIGGYRDFSGDPDNFLTLPVVFRSFAFMDDAQTHSHELRLNGDLGGVIYQVGGFYFNEQLDRESGFFLPFLGANGGFISYFGRAIESESLSAFGQIEVPVTETITLVGGLRYTDNQRDAVFLNGSPFFNPNADRFAGTTPPPGGPPDNVLAGPTANPADFLFGSGLGRKNILNLPYLQTLDLTSSENKVTWLVGVNWQPNPDTLVYGKVSTGFKGGGFDSVGTYAPENNTAFESGLKLNWGGSGQHILNLSAFYYDYQDLQVSVLIDSQVGGQVFNAGKATIWGLEAEAMLAVGDSGTLRATYNYLNAEYDELLASTGVFCVGGCGITSVGDLDPVTPGIQQPNFAGNTPPFSPEHVLTLAYSHEFDAGSLGQFTFNVDTLVKSSYFTDFFNRNDGHQNGITQTGASLEFRPDGSDFSILAFVRNIENTRALSFGGLTNAGPDDIFNWQFGTPRTYGVRLAFEY